MKKGTNAGQKSYVRNKSPPGPSVYKTLGRILDRTGRVPSCPASACTLPCSNGAAGREAVRPRPTRQPPCAGGSHVQKSLGQMESYPAVLDVAGSDCHQLFVFLPALQWQARALEFHRAAAVRKLFHLGRGAYADRSRYVPPLPGRAEQLGQDVAGAPGRRRWSGGSSCAAPCAAAPPGLPGHQLRPKPAY